MDEAQTAVISCGAAPRPADRAAAFGMGSQFQPFHIEAVHLHHAMAGLVTRFDDFRPQYAPGIPWRQWNPIVERFSTHYDGAGSFFRMQDNGLFDLVNNLAIEIVKRFDQAKGFVFLLARRWIVERIWTGAAQEFNYESKAKGRSLSSALSAFSGFL